MLAFRAKKPATEDSLPNMRGHTGAIASSNPVRDISEDADDLIKRAAHLSRMS
jgi:hypothetical protein